MKLFQSIVLLLKVLVLLTVSASAAWASNPLSSAGAGFSAMGVPGPTIHAIYKSDSEPGDQGQGGSSGDDDQTDGDGGADGGGSGDGGDNGDDGDAGDEGDSQT
ncbi:hypothetical protein [Pseudomonas fragi]|uniref:hypothetical protein n=1 Tax=Pseudomonas fragi TaxID=296 RepID=UPI00147367D5|nr:hypothetical protein [Pseudomonas fragi]NNB00397.1 hypothetical protein [Pseudomonas fragi]